MIFVVLLVHRFEPLTAVTMKNAVFWDVMPCGSCRNRRFRGRITSNIRITKIGKLGTMLAIYSQHVSVASYGYRCSWLADSRLPDVGGHTFLRNVVPYKSHVA
jgi:hypothetical protein